MSDQEFYCNTDLLSQLDPTLFPVGTATFLNPNYNILPYLCNLIKVIDPSKFDDDFNPVLVEPPEFDIRPFTDFSGLLQVGDPRVSLGIVMSATFIHFLPRVITQLEVRQSGGTQIIDNYICDGDGNPIKQSNMAPIILSIDISGASATNFGALNIPPIATTVEELMKPLDVLEIKDFVNLYVKNARKDHAESFSDFIKIFFLSDNKNSVKLKYINMTKMFFAQIDMYSSTTKIPENLLRSVFLKYYEDAKEDVARFLNVDSVEYTFGFGLNFSGMEKVMASTIPNYREIMSTNNNQNEWYQYVLTNYATDSTAMNPYGLFFNNLTGNFNDPDFLRTTFSEFSGRFLDTLTRFQSTSAIPLGQQYVSMATTPFSPPSNRV